MTWMIFKTICVVNHNAVAPNLSTSQLSDEMLFLYRNRSHAKDTAGIRKAQLGNQIATVSPLSSCGGGLRDCQDNRM